MKATAKNAKTLKANFGWLTFKNLLGKELGKPADPTKWDVPNEWQEAFKKANGR